MNPIPDEDYQVWEMYPQYRWIFNKLEIALKLGYKAGPACVPIKEKGYYIVRPIYNLYGMGIGAKKIWLDPNLHHDEMIAHMHCDPGTFWCQWLHGNHYSIDYIRENGKWKPFCAMIGQHESDENLIRFVSWKKVNPPIFQLPSFVNEIDNVHYLNVESKDGKPFEFHLRSGNDALWDFNIGTTLIPVWSDEKIDPSRQFVPNLHEDSFAYQAGGHLDVYRIGYYVHNGENG